MTMVDLEKMRLEALERHAKATQVLTNTPDTKALRPTDTDKIGAIRCLMAERDDLLAAIGGCGDGGCVIVRPVGQHTNGGCRCWMDKMTMQRFALIERRITDAIKQVIHD